MIIRATQKKRISNPVNKADVGKKSSKSGVFSGQPSATKGQSEEENQVSKTSSSCFNTSSSSSLYLKRTSFSVYPTYTFPWMSYQAGMRCPHQSWRLMHQSWMFSIQGSYVFVQLSGTKRTCPWRTTSSAGFASGSIWIYHWSVSSGSIIVFDFSPRGMLSWCGSIFSRRPAWSKSLIICSRATKRSMPW